MLPTCGCSGGILVLKSGNAIDDESGSQTDSPIIMARGSNAFLSLHRANLSLDGGAPSGAQYRHNAAFIRPSEVVPMKVSYIPALQRRICFVQYIRQYRPACIFFVFVVLAPGLALAQSGSPFDTGFTALQTLFTGTIAKVASLIAIVIGGYEFAHGAPGAKKTLAGVAAGTGIAVLATNILSWLWGM